MKKKFTFQQFCSSITTMIMILFSLVIFPVVTSPKILAQPLKSSQPRPKVSSLILLSVDGLMPDHLVKYKDRIPNLRNLLKEGISASGVQGVLPTLTYPSHATLITGVHPARHGIINNGVFDPLNIHQDAWHWFATDIAVPTLWEVAKGKGLTTASVDWPVSVGAKGVDYNLVQYWRDSTDLDRKMLQALSTPGLFAEVEKIVGPYPAGHWDVDSDQIRTKSIITILKKKNPQLLTAYLSSVDKRAHHYGPMAPQTLEAVEAIDQMIGLILKRKNPDTVLAIVSDHGFIPAGKGINLNALLLKNHLIVREGEKVVSWKAYTWEGQGVAAIFLNPEVNPEEKQNHLKQISSLLKTLQAEHPEAIDQIIENPQDLYPGASFLVAAHPGYQFTPHYQEPVVGGPVPYPFTHGYLPKHQAMDAVFILHGPGLSPKNLGKISMVDVAPTLAALLGLSLKQAQGRNLLEGR